MKLIEALAKVNGMGRPDGSEMRCFLAAGINSLHLRTFLIAELAMLCRKVEMFDGVYGDLAGNIGKIAEADVECGIVIIEWADFDPRLGIRSTARWKSDEVADIRSTAETRGIRILREIQKVPRQTILAVSLPTLPLPPFSFNPTWQTGPLELGLRAIQEEFTFELSSFTHVRILSRQWLDLVSPAKERFDIESETMTGCPYKLQHASTIAGGLARLTQRPRPRRGLITDLDNTLWHGVLGEEGIDGISWDMDHQSQMHAFYQRFLGALGSEGVFLGIASKNDAPLTAMALKRPDLACSETAFFPIESNWGPKSESVTRILQAWNVGADSVVIVDDSALELAEVKALHPEIECLQFPSKDDATSIYDLCLKLRDLFGKSELHEEDSIRLESIRHSRLRPVAEKTTDASAQGLLKEVGAEISFSFEKTPLDLRVLELVNKTNQFNLNGQRYTEASWMKYLSAPTAVLLVASYRDKFGPLGKIAALAGQLNRGKLTIDMWVMSCRAFSRRIEHGCLAAVFSRFNLDEVECAFSRTERNGPLREFLTEITGKSPTPGCVIRRENLDAFPEMTVKTQEAISG